MLPNGQLKMLSESEHNHTAVGHLPSVGGSTSKSALASTETAGGKGRSYRLFKNQRGQMTMLYNGYRYSIRNRNQDGSSSWKCRANSTCRVTIFLMPDDRIVMGSSSTEHNHEPNWESTKKLEVVSQTRVNPLYDYLNIVPGGSSQSISKAQTTAKTDHPAVSVAAPQQSQAPAPVSDASSFGRNVIEHKGFYYKLVVRKKNGREYWRCVHFKTRVCRAALFCRDNGTVVTSSNGKEHTHGGGADAKPVPSANSNKLLAPSVGQQQVRSVAQPSPPDEVQIAVGDEERYIDHGEYVIAKNRKDQNTLIFKDRRYYLSYNRSDGSAVWRCAHRKRYKCYAYVRLRPDGRLLSTGDHEHSHTSKTDEQIPQAQAPRGAVETRNYRIVKNRVGNDILIHDSHRFRLNYQRNDGTTHWRCIWARSNHCSAGVYLFSSGLLRNAANEAAIIHNHPPPSQVKKAVTANVNVPAQLNQQGQNSVASGGGSQSSRTIPEDDGISDYKFVEEGSNKILICRGYRYWYTWIRKDGSIYYRCAEVKNLQCPMGILLLPNRKLIRANDNCHNHDASPDEQEEEFLGFPAEVVQHVDLSHQQQQQPQQDVEVFEQFQPLSIPPGGDADFKIVKTSRGESLIYKGYRYWAKNRLANGVVSLCCTRKKMKKCPAMLRLMTDGRVTDPIGAGHTHPPSIENNSGGGEVVRIRPPAPSRPTVPTVVLPVREPPALAREPPPTVTPAAKLTALSFNEESDDETDTVDESLMGSKRYTFVKSSAQRNFIVYQDFLYDFEHKQHDGCVFYRCKTSEACPATLMLLTNGRVMNMDEVLHIHEKPDLSNLRPVGRGSKEFKIVQNKNGSNILVHRGHRYTTPRAKTDGAGIWYCHTYIPDVNRRCYVPIELLPNGRVAPVGDKQHNHKAPFKTKHDADNELAAVGNGVGDPGAVKAENNRMLLLGGHRYNYAHKRDDGAVLWKCAQKSCNASMYRLTDGHIVRGPEHNHEKMESFDSAASKTTTTTTTTATAINVKRKFSELNHTKAKSSSPIVSALGSSRSAQQHSRGGPESPVKVNPYIGKSIINEGYRYIYYLTRRDGSEHWRCCRRISMKCRGGLFKQVDGTLMKSNDEGHSHPPDHADHEDFIPMPSTLEEPPHHEESNDTVIVELEEEEPTSTDEPTPAVIADEGSYDYELIDVKGKKRGFYLVHKGAMFVTGHTRRDRARYYRCRTVGCKVAMLLHRNGLLVRSNEHTHDCQNAVKPEEDDKIASLAQESEDLSNGGIPEEKKPRLDEQDEVVQVSPEEEVKEPDVEESMSNSNESTECVVVEVKDDESL